MLDVHPPHSPTHTWKDFLIHIATIVVGLLIAIGLEQTVEYPHERKLVAEIRNALETERLININRFEANTKEFRREIVMLLDNRAVFVYLKQHPGAPESEWPAKLEWYQVFLVPRDSVWLRAQQDNVLSHLPDAEARHIASLYRELDILAVVLREKVKAIHSANTYAVAKLPSQLTPAEIDREIEYIDKSIATCEEVAWEQRTLTRTFPDFDRSPTWAEMRMDGPAHAEPTHDGARILDEAHEYASKLEAERGEGK